MLFGKTTYKAQPLATVKASALPWHTEGLLVLVEQARSTLRWETSKAGPEGTRRSLVLGDTPLLFAETDDYWCPTCEKLLALGMGRENVDPRVLDALRQVSSQVEAPLASAVEALSPLLELMGDGVYLISRVPHYPTNGEGQPFWALSRQPQRLTASRDWYFSDLGLFRLAHGFPAFLLPTEGLARCDWSRVEEYRQQIRSGRNLGALDEHIEYLFAGQAGGAPELWLILQALIASKDPRAVKLALRVGRSYLPDLWNDAFRFLATVRAQEVEDFFIDFLVRDEGQHPWLEKTANDYLAESAS